MAWYGVAVNQKAKNALFWLGLLAMGVLVFGTRGASPKGVHLDDPPSGKFRCQYCGYALVCDECKEPVD